MIEGDREVAAVEIVHLAGSHVDCADRQARALGIEALEIHQAAHRLAQVVDRIEGGLFDADQGAEPAPGDRAVWGVISGNAVEH